MTVNISADNGRQCCVSDEIGNFLLEKGARQTFRASGKTSEEAAKNLLASIVEKVSTGEDTHEPWEYDGQAVRYFWFKKGRDYKGNYPAEYEFEELRKEVQNYPNVVKLGEYINANTGNMVDGYMIVIDCKANSYEEDDED